MQCAEHHAACPMVQTGETQSGSGVTWECPTCGKVQRVQTFRGRTEISTVREGRLRSVFSESTASVVESRQNEQNRTVQCAAGHPALNMVEFDFEFIGTWYQCPQCLTKRLVTTRGILNEADGEAAISDAREKTRRRSTDLARSVGSTPAPEHEKWKRQSRYER
jgi:rubredoxin